MKKTPADPVQLGRAAARKKLSGWGDLSPLLLERYAAAGNVYSFAGDVLVALEVPEPILGTNDLYLPVVSSSLLAHGATRRRLLEAFQLSLGVDRLVARTSQRLVSVPEDGLVHAAEFLSKQPWAAQLSRTVEIKQVDESSAEFVRELLRRAMANGYADEVLDPGRVADYVAEAFQFGPGSTASALVAWLNEKPVGHLTWVEAVEDEVTGRQFTELVDVYVVEGLEAHGISRELTQALENLAAPWGRRLRGNVLTAPDDSHSRVAAALSAGDWRSEFHLWIDRGPSTAP